MRKNILFMLLFALFFIACNENSTETIEPDSTDVNYGNNGDNGDSNNSGNSGSGGDEPGNNNTSVWLIPISEVKDGGPGKDGIPSIDHPKFVNASDSQADFLMDNDLIVGIVYGNETKAYPHLILDWHEIINDKFNEEFVTISYCPLTGTAFGWESYVNNVKTTFGVSGLIYNSNLILYDRKSDSNWSQLKLQCVNGVSIGDKPKIVDVVETSWGMWKSLYPNTKVLTLDTGFNRSYDDYPYGDYKTNHDRFIFTASPSNNALPNKQRVYAIIDGENSKVYQFDKFGTGKVFKDIFNGDDYLVVGNENLIYSFKLVKDQADLNFEYNFNNSESFFKDDEGNKWSIFGEAIEGPRAGEKLNPSKSVVSFWFAIAAFYPNPIVYN